VVTQWAVSSRLASARTNERTSNWRHLRTRIPPKTRLAHVLLLPRTNYSEECSGLCTYLHGLNATEKTSLPSCIVITARRHASGVYATFPCLSVRLSVCLSHTDIVSKKVNMQSMPHHLHVTYYLLTWYYHGGSI